MAPRGKKPGSPKTGGKVKGTPNKATIEKALIAERAVEEARQSGRKLAKEVLEEFMMTFAGMAAFYQPMPDGAVPKREQNEEKFQTYARYAVETASKLAPYQSPTFRAITVAPAPTMNQGTKRTITFAIFDGDKTPIKTISNEVKGAAPKAARG